MNTIGRRTLATNANRAAMTSNGSLLSSVVARVALGVAGMWPFLAMAQDASSVMASGSATTSVQTDRDRRTTKRFCSRLQRVLDSQPSSSDASMEVSTVDGGGRSDLYQGIDLDRDGQLDQLERGCGSSSDGSCTLYVATSSGQKYEFDGRPFYVGVFEGRYYIIEGNSFPRKPRQRDRNIYLLTETLAKRVCKSI
jgi:hypothetical protein